jgi:cell division protein FtsI/penicillin-binding protein 2
LPASQTEQAADAIGQGRVQVSPLLMALMAGAVTSGVPERPSLVAGTTAAPGASLPPGLVSKMTALMKATVDLPRGTGHVLADLPGVEGKTGTAEYGTAKPPRTHTWFAGVQGDVAFAVFVYDGATVGINGAKIANTFLQGLR